MIWTYFGRMYRKKQTNIYQAISPSVVFPVVKLNSRICFLKKNRYSRTNFVATWEAQVTFPSFLDPDSIFCAVSGLWGTRLWGRGQWLGVPIQGAFRSFAVWSAKTCISNRKAIPPHTLHLAYLPGCITTQRTRYSGPRFWLMSKLRVLSEGTLSF